MIERKAWSVAAVDRKSKHNVEEERAGFRGNVGSDPVPESGVGHKDWGDDWVHELIEMTRPGIEINWPVRGLQERPIPFEFDDFD